MLTRSHPRRSPRDAGARVVVGDRSPFARRTWLFSSDPARCAAGDLAPPGLIVKCLASSDNSAFRRPPPGVASHRVAGREAPFDGMLPATQAQPLGNVEVKVAGHAL